MTTWEHASSKLGNVTEDARKIAKEIFDAAQAAGHDVWFIWGDGAQEEHSQNHTKGKPVFDFMVRTEAAGDFVRDYTWTHRQRLGLQHTIWEQHITSTVNQPGVRRKMPDRGNPTANHFDHNHSLFFKKTYVPPVSTTPVDYPASGRLDVDGELGPKTIAKWQRVMGTPVDGVITPGDSLLVRAVQRHLAARVNHRLVVDGDGIYQDGRQYKTVGALQTYLGTPVDLRISMPRSQVVMALQRRLNEDRF